MCFFSEHHGVFSSYRNAVLSGLSISIWFTLFLFSLDYPSDDSQFLVCVLYPAGGDDVESCVSSLSGNGLSLYGHFSSLCVSASTKHDTSHIHPFTHTQEHPGCSTLSKLSCSRGGNVGIERAIEETKASLCEQKKKRERNTIEERSCDRQSCSSRAQREHLDRCGG